MVKICDLLSRNTPIFKEDFGVEIEVEGKGLDRVAENLPIDWRCDRDGSLRGGLEFILYPPKYLRNLEENIDRLQASFKKEKAKIEITERTGTHLHMNVTSLTPVQLVNFMCCYYIVEEALIEICGENRIGNHFCLRAIDADLVIRIICNSLSDNYIFNLRDDTIRYSAMNFCSLFKFGTVEFRAIQTNKLFKSSVLGIAKILLLLREKSISLNLPEDILFEFSDVGPIDFLKNLLGDSFKLIENVSNFELKCKRGMRFAQDIIYSRRFEEDFTWGIERKKKSHSINLDMEPFDD